MVVLNLYALFQCIHAWLAYLLMQSFFSPKCWPVAALKEVARKLSKYWKKSRAGPMMKSPTGVSWLEIFTAALEMLTLRWGIWWQLCRATGLIWILPKKSRKEAITQFLSFLGKAKWPKGLRYVSLLMIRKPCVINISVYALLLSSLEESFHC